MSHIPHRLENEWRYRMWRRHNVRQQSDYFAGRAPFPYPVHGFERAMAAAKRKAASEATRK
jgi:hypothetical protein